MENRDRDKVSRNTESTSAGDVNRETSQRQGNLNDDSTAEFGQNIGRSENLNEPNRRGEGIGEEGMRGDRGRSGGSVGSGGGVGSEIDSDLSRDRESMRDRGSRQSGGRSGSSESEH
jgi:hypothetical protein